MRLSFLIFTVGFSFACGNGGGGGNDAGSDVAHPTDSSIAKDSASSDAPTPIEASTNDASAALVTQCQSLATQFATLCAGSDPRPCLWNGYANLCATGATQLLVDSMNCLDQTTCRTFSDPNEGETCLDTTHTTEESAVSSQYIVDTCTACGDSNCEAQVGIAEIFPYLTDADIVALAACQGNACNIDDVVQNCAATIPDIAFFASCVQQ